MPDISSIGPGPLGPISRSERAGTTETGQSPRDIHSSPTTADRVELSDHAQFLDRLRRLPEVRDDLVEAARGAIANGTYESDDRVNTAIERMLEDLD